MHYKLKGSSEDPVQVTCPRAGQPESPQGVITDNAR